MADPVKIYLDQNGKAEQFDKLLQGASPQLTDDETIIVTKSAGTVNGQPIVAVTHMTLEEDTDVAHRAFTVLTMEQLAMAVGAIAGAHPVFEEHIRDMFTLPEVEPTRSTKHGLVDGVAYDAIPFNGYIVRVEGQPEGTVHLAPGVDGIEGLVKLIIKEM